MLLRKVFSSIRKIIGSLRSLAFSLKSQFFMEGVVCNSCPKCGKGVFVSCTDGGKLIIGSNVYLGNNVKIIVQGGDVYIGDNSYIGDGVIIASKEEIKIGADALIAEYVVIRDQDHSLDADPINKTGFKTAPIVIENNVWLGAKVSVLKGNHIGSGAVIASNAVVTKDVPSRHIFGGVPAKSIAVRD
jgi:acetyltransferase-like isoleucine patch superfamily enzyme